MKNYSAPFLGVAYYPEDWDKSEISYDIEMMKKAGIKCVRLAEFAWSMMEQEEGKFDFSWLHYVMDKLEEADISIILCTPSATPPIWLSQKYPDVTVLKDGVRKTHGGRRHCCSNHPKYIEYSMRIANEMGKEFGSDKRVIGWQIDNEIEPTKCECDYCVSAFHKYLENKYKTIDALNLAWNTNLFSQKYTSFNEIPIPKKAWHNAHILLDYNLFDSSSQARFINEQANILKKHTTAPIGTDAIPSIQIGYDELNENLDVMQYNHYDSVEELPLERLWFDHARTIKNRPFWNTETATCWNGSNSTSQSLKPYGFCRINSWLPIALGGEANMYWLWRTHWAGHEMTHGAVISSCGRPLHVFDEVRRVADEFEKCADFINGTKVETNVALHYSSFAWNLFKSQGMVNGFDYDKVHYANFYTPIVNSGIRPDVITTTKDLSNYKLLFSPLLPTLEENNLVDRITKWVENGGVWVVGPMTDIRNEYGAKYKKSPYGYLENMLNITQAYEIPDTEGMIKCKWNNNSEFLGNYRYELFETDENSLVTVTQGYPTIIGKSVVVKKKLGKGTVYLIGAIPSKEDMKKIISLASLDAGVKTSNVIGDLALVSRKGEKYNGFIAMECAGRQGAFTLDKEMTDILTGKKFFGKINLSPYELLVLVE